LFDSAFYKQSGILAIKYKIFYRSGKVTELETVRESQRESGNVRRSPGKSGRVRERQRDSGNVRENQGKSERESWKV